ncbi:RcpC/CpaB family pilus assembly protein [Actinomadura madurae]|uniref:RcpC/CpaB family pilus assembly protein n=3 Tax=Actinomadura madurae TaxID=1993 RepID=UPI00202664EE|nr:RcpC/CpaB family pilus assembly protein [Actinomadura madurae]MCP9953436.1 RcpC/CpaB family pilus assembly protein [Actinomadura madurae]MCP9970198.1 RcpC/CpaB family pilus assembly protein [Actinomadura madurae]MCQ0005791.1 RcpC/CpaB family pilus assembly protein [Actinomadura madurae]URM98930.1 RcpC/CpaB family pilus assembly protein [Actinomadura madurae]
MSVRSARLRRPLAALFAAAAAGLALTALRPGPPPSVRVLGAARDLPAGKALTASDLRPVALPPGAVPAGALRSGGAGRVLAGPMREGEPLTDARVVGDGLLRGQGPGTVATPVRMADAGAVRLLRPGDRIDVLTVPSGSAEPDGTERWGREARVVVSGVPVVAVPRPDDRGGREGALVVLATDRAQAVTLAGAGAPLALTITGH